MGTFGIIGAMAIEIEKLRQQMELVSEQRISGMNFLSGTINGNDVVVVQCGVGKVNAAICAQTLILHFGVTAIINVGIAGGLRDVKIGDIVVSQRVWYHDYDQLMMMRVECFESDGHLAYLALEAGHNIQDINVKPGGIVSGDQFISSASVKNDIIKRYDALCVEMEGAAIAHVAHLSNTPFVIIRSISDFADDSADITFEEFAEHAAYISSQLVFGMLLQK